MWKKILFVLFALSLALNVAFATTWALRTFAGNSEERRGRRATTGETDVWSPLHRELEVSAEQWKQIEPHMREFMEKMEARHEHISRVRQDMVDLLFSEDVTREVIEKQQERVLKAFRETQDLVLQHVLTERKYLKPEQERMLKRMLEDRMDTSGPGNPPIGGGKNTSGRGVGKAFQRLEKAPQEEE